MKKVKDPNRLRFKEYFGTTAMAGTNSIAEALMTSWFMVYLTDYAGIGKWGAILGSALLLIARLFDAVNDPLEGWLMDRAKPGKLGKYKPFIILSILMTALGIACLFFMPSSFRDNPVMICVWVIFFYLIYDIGYSFYAPNLIYRSLTLNSIERGKLLIAPRMMSMIMGMVVSSLIVIVNNVNSKVNNMHDAFGITVLAIVLVICLISLVGISLIRERHITQQDEDEKFKITEIFTVIRENKALQVKAGADIFGGFIWTFLFATLLYYVKWAYCADLTTGAVNTELYGTLSLIGSMMMFLPLIVGTLIATPLMKLLGSAIKLHRLQILTESISCGLMFILHLTGILKLSPIALFVCIGITAVCIGVGYIPEETLKIECMDYEIYLRGKDRSALVNACNKFVNKAQSAISSGLIGVVLVAIGYVVDSETDTYIGELSAMPTLITWFVVIMGLVPCILGAIALFILKHYPVTDEIRADMRKVLDK